MVEWLSKTIRKSELLTKSTQPTTQPNTTSGRVTSNSMLEEMTHNSKNMEPVTKEEREQAIKTIHERGIHLKAVDTRISIYGDKFNIAVPVRFYRQNTAKVDQAMEELGFVKGNAGTLNNVFFSRPLKGGKPA